MINENLAFELDFHAVGTGEKSGDAISIRYGRLNSVTNFSQKVIVIDGGTLESGKKLVEHIKTHYKTETVDLVVNTHPDNDHCSGLREVLNNLTVKELWVHTPWNYAKDFVDLFKDGRITDNSLKEKLKEGLNIAHELEQLAKEKKIPVKEPYTGLSYDNGVFQILGPSEDYYTELLPNFRSTPAPVEESAISKAFTAVKDAIKWVAESMDIETLDELGETSAENNSSAISLFNYSDKKILFTSDTGIPALKKAIEYAKSKSITLNNLSVLQVPHHGSKRNISPSIIDALKCTNAYISCAPNGEPKHPAKKVTNAFKRRGIKPYWTKNNGLCHRHNTPSREGWSTATEIPFYDKVEE
jgi:beta-lactamase superfamily II metal-dependent hydrolase